MGHKHSKLKGKKATKEQKSNPTNATKNIRTNAEIGHALKKVPLLAHLSSNERAKLGGGLEIVKFSESQLVFSEGDKASAKSSFYIIKEGSCTCEQGGQIVCELGQGDYFGEQALLHGTDRNATIKGGPDGMLCWQLTKEKFEALFQSDGINVEFLNREKVLERPRKAVAAESPAELKIDTSNLKVCEMPESTKDLVYQAVQNSLLFAGLDEHHKALAASCMSQKEVKSGLTIIEEGRKGNTFYVVEQGSVDVYQWNNDTEENVKCDFKTIGNSFGELALMYNAPRNATVVANGDVLVRVLSRTAFNQIRRSNQQKIIEARTAFLSKVELLGKLSNFERTCMAEALEVKVHAAGDVIFREGDQGDSMYLIQKGEVAFSEMKDDKDTPITGQYGVFGQGKYFGERALLNKAPRAASATCVTECTFLIIDRSLFENLLGPLAKILEKKDEEYLKRAETETIIDWKKADVEFKNLVQKGVLGRGSFGWVTLVEDSKTGTKYALKAVSKQRIVETQQKTHIFNEKNLLARMDNPFLIKLISTFNDADSLYFLLEPSLGGELFRVLRAVKAFPPSQARFYAACVISGFAHLHSQNLIYRDLKPENLLIGEDGYIKITDFGFCKEVKHKTHTMCGTPEYLSPEIVTAHGHGKPVDWWCVGILIYEMLVSHTPFYRPGEDQMEMYRRIVSGHVRYPSHLTPDAKNLISRLLELQPSRRLGSSQVGSKEITSHPWFGNFNFEDLYAKQLKAPFIPSQREVKKLSNFASNSEPIKIKKYVDDGTGWDKDF